jgi:aryl-alcohol dehydrogenase-like predicted oxidoreductase
LQSEYSLWERNLAPEIIPVLRELGIGLGAFCPLSRSFLIGEVHRAEEHPESDFRRHRSAPPGRELRRQRQGGANSARYRRSKRAKPGQITLAWLLQKGEDIVPIPGTKHRKYLEENVAAQAVHFEPSQMKTLD